MQIPAPTTAPVPTIAPDAPIEAFVADLLPRIPGLPDASTPGWSVGDLLGPPRPGSIADRADMAAVKGAQRLRTPERDAWAVRMAEDGAAKIWFDFAKRHRSEVGSVRGWLDTALLASTLAATATVSHFAKAKYDRPRPYQVDSSITPPVRLPRSSSYPSGHSSSAFAAARVIAALQPKLAREAYSIASQVAASRVYAGVHFPSDVVAGALLGTGVADIALRTMHQGPKAVTAAVAAASI
jgi:membrane-associated phospholipid phosphatase